MRVAVVSTEREVHDLHRQIVESYDEANRCSPHQPPHPELGVLERVLDPEQEVWRLYAVRRRRRLLLVALVEADSGRISWLCHAAPVGESVVSGAFRALVERIHADCGACFGHVENPELRALLASEPRVLADGEKLTWDA